MPWIIAFLIISILILINALYVAAEFSTVTARRSRMVQYASEGNGLARLILPIMQDRQRLDTYVATCQLGITASSLLLGFFGQARLTPILAPYLSGIPGLTETVAISIAATVVLISLTSLQVILGELVPKSISIQYPEQLAFLTAIPMRWSSILFKPLIWVFNGSGHFVLKLLGVDIKTHRLHIHAPKEILMLFEESSAGGLLDREERRLLMNALQLRQLAIRQVMIPRNRMVAASVDEQVDELLALLADSPFSRLPLFDTSIDNIVGIVHLKDLLCLRFTTLQKDVRQAMRPILFVPENNPVDEVFALLQRKRYHAAIVLDEYGGTAGFVSLEDLIEEIFGELQDEFDTDTTPHVTVLSEDQVIVRGDMLIEELNEALDLNLPSTEVDTVGGLVLSTLGHVPAVGEQISLEDLTMTVEAMDGKGITSLRLEVTPEQIAHLQEWI
jgi:putative hemolysin